MECGLHSKNIVGVTGGLHSKNCNGLECGLHSKSSGVGNALGAGDMIGNKRLEVLMIAASETSTPVEETAADITLLVSLSRLSCRSACVLCSPSLGCCFGHYNLEKLIKSCFLLALASPASKTGTELERGSSNGTADRHRCNVHSSFDAPSSPGYD